jgi:hypothetical protein
MTSLSISKNILFIGNSLSVLPANDHFGGRVYRELQSLSGIQNQESYSRSGWNTSDFLEGASRTTRRRNLQISFASIPPFAEFFQSQQRDVVISQLGTNMFYYLVYFGEEKIHQMLNDYLSVMPASSQCVWILPPHIGHGHRKSISLRNGRQVELSYNAYQYYMEKVMAEHLSKRCFLFDSLDLEELVNGDTLNDFIHYHNEDTAPGVERMEEIWANQFLSDYEVLRSGTLPPEEYNQTVLRRVRSRFSAKKNLRPYFQYQSKNYSFEELVPLFEL